MKTIDYSFNGGLPLSQNVLNWTQTGLLDAVNALYKMGYNGVPMAITGVVYDATTGDVSAGWIFDGNEVHYFPGGNTVTAGTNLIKLQTSTTTVVFESGASQPIYKNSQYLLDNTGAINVIDIRRYGLTILSTSIGVGITEAATSLAVRVNTATRTMHLFGQIDTLNADVIAVDGLQVKVVDDTDFEANPVFGPHYPKQTIEFLGTVMPTGTGSGVFNDVNGNPITSVALRLNSNGLYAVLRKTTAGNYSIYVNQVFFID